jgi:hypothetical protein
VNIEITAWPLPCNIAVIQSMCAVPLNWSATSKFARPQLVATGRRSWTSADATLVVQCSCTGSKGYPPENAETPADRVGRVEQLLFQFLEKVSRPLENTFAMLRKKKDFLRLLRREFSCRFRVSRRD